MSVSSLATALSVAAPAAPSPNNIVGKTDVPTRTPFARILASGKPVERPADAAAKMPAKDAADSEPDTDGTAADADASTTNVAPDDLTAAADQGLSAVLALLGSMPPAPTAPAPVAVAVAVAVAPAPTTTTVATDAGAPVAAATVAKPPAVIAMPAPDVPIATPAAPAPKVPVDIAGLSPADQNLLRNMIAAIPAGKKDGAASPVNADTATTLASDPDISSMAAALNRAFGKAQDGTAAAPMATPSAAVAPIAIPLASVNPIAAPSVAAAPTTTPSVANDIKPATPSLPAAPLAEAAPGVHAAPPADDTPAPKHAATGQKEAVTKIDMASLTTRDASDTAFSLSSPNMVSTDATTLTTGIAQPTHAEQSITRHLDMLSDTKWLDTLAHDISQAATKDGNLKFQINPEHLGSLAIEITHSAAGASIRMTTENDTARAIIADAQPRLIEEVRAQGLRVAGSHVDMGSQANSGGTAGQRQSSENHKPFVRTQVGTSEVASDSQARDDELYA